MSEQKFDQIREHSFDGIQEYDNPMPGWWKNIFWLTIIFSGFYLVYYVLGPGESIQQEYARVSSHVEQLQAAYMKRMAKNLNEKSLIALSKKPGTVKAGAALFKEHCALCHGQQGQGIVGPNLTDKYWIFGPKRMDIYKVLLKGGRKGKGMQAWENELKIKGMMQVAIYVATLRGKNLKGKRVDGEKAFDMSKLP
jgi:cytochrome c oxidase cbb3-type subunit 3